MCQFMAVSRSAYYAWLKSPQTAAEKNDVELTEVIKALFKKSRRNYGTRRLKEALINKERQVSRRRIGRLMEAAGLACKTKRKFKATTNSKHSLPIAPIIWIGNSQWRNRIRPMSATSLIFLPRKVGCTWL